MLSQYVNYPTFGLASLTAPAVLIARQLLGDHNGHTQSIRNGKPSMAIEILLETAYRVRESSDRIFLACTMHAKSRIAVQ